MSSTFERKPCVSKASEYIQQVREIEKAKAHEYFEETKNELKKQTECI